MSFAHAKIAATASILAPSRCESGAAEHPAEDRIHMGEMEIQVEILRQFLLAQVLADVLVGLEQFEEIAFAFPDLHRVALHEAIGVFARDALLRQRQQDALGMNQAAETVEVLHHVFWVDDQLLYDAGEATQRKIEC